MIKLYEEQTMTLNEIQNKAGLGGRTLYRYADGSRNIANMPMKILIKIAEAVNEVPYELYMKMVRYLDGR